VKKHPQFGYELLKNLPLDEHIKLAALMHHERCDGSGYPNHLSSDDIDDCAMIVAIADVYDAMTAARPHRAPLCPFQVISNFEKDGLSQYRPKYILTFLEYIASTYQNNRVLLNNGQSANIVMINKNHLSAPIVQLDDQSCINLQEHPDLFIKSIL
jgi:HD-GYP domain-containing protein (c-di-GMP phosphodiesterase class II)